MFVVGADLLQGLQESDAVHVGCFGDGGRAADADVVDGAVAGRGDGGVVRVEADGVGAGEGWKRSQVVLDGGGKLGEGYGFAFEHLN